jgi:hypothetical protein
MSKGTALRPFITSSFKSFGPPHAGHKCPPLSPSPPQRCTPPLSAYLCRYHRRAPIPGCDCRSYPSPVPCQAVLRHSAWRSSLPTRAATSWCSSDGRCTPPWHKTRCERLRRACSLPWKQKSKIVFFRVWWTTGGRLWGRLSLCPEAIEFSKHV